MRKTPEHRFWLKLYPEGNCWLWTGYVSPQGAMLFTVGRKIVTARRFAYEMVKGPLPKGARVRQKGWMCFRPLCVNPKHMRLTEPWTAPEGTTPLTTALARAREDPVVYCFQGHRMYGDNVYTEPNGRRKCKTCGRLYSLKTIRRRGS